MTDGIKQVIISPYAAKLRSGQNNPKNYPYWQELVQLLKNDGFRVIQVGVAGENIIGGVDEVKFSLSFDDLYKLIFLNNYSNNEVISVDSFIPHFCSNCSELPRRSTVIWGQSDPNIFGYSHNLNLLKNRKYLRKEQFLFWENVPYIKESFLTAEEIFTKLKECSWFTK